MSTDDNRRATNHRGSYTYEIRGNSPLDEAQRQALAQFAIAERSDDVPTDRAARALELLGQGVGIVEPSGELVWMNHGLSRQSPEALRKDLAR